MSTVHRPRKSHAPDCDLRAPDDYPATCAGHEQVVLVALDNTERRLCPGHAAAVWLTDPTHRFSAKTRPETIAAVMGYAFGPGNGGRR
ncbi:hypothetical protein AB0465_27100 [Streptomyces griseoviridis]|uniref:hypothetical protein n=1 Tax=Streptomyces TaxID=1883 RepID=UPI0022BA3581|nr:MULTISPECIES: hypothetical protein [Streptomyces]MCZ9351405.1 hypothetical protein [Streptomyces mutabilis]MDH6701566.1 hypothetical protein [Streptomyces sp. MAA16]